jgi:hypothetical protein
MTKSKKRPVILKSTIDQEDQTLPIANIPLNSSGDLGSPSELVVIGDLRSLCEGLRPSDQISTETTNINLLVCEKKPRKSTKKTKMSISEMDKVNEITDQILPVALPPSKLVVIGDLRSLCEGILPSDQTLPVALLPSKLVVKRQKAPRQTSQAYVPTLSSSELVVGDSMERIPPDLTSPAYVPTMSPSKLVVIGDRRSLCEGLRPSDQSETTPQLPNSASKNQTTKKPPTSKKTKRGKLNNTVSDNKRNEILPTIQIANIILHLKCSANDLEIYNEEINRQLTDPLLYNPSVPPDIMTYQPAEQYSVLEETKPSNNTPENYAYSESKNRIVVQGSNKFSEIEIEVPNETTPKTDENIESTGLNMKEINTKLKKLKISLFKNMSFMDKKSACFWCTYDFDNPECYIPRYEMDGTVHGYGSFCRPECAAAYLMKENLDDSTKFERYHMLNQIYGKIYGYKKNIKPSPNPYYLLDKFYGNLTIQEYRKLLKSDHLLLVIDKPLTRILPELHEDNEEFLTSIYGNNTTITGGTNTQSIGATSAKSNTFGVYKVRRQSEKPVGVTKTSIIKEHFGITT